MVARQVQFFQMEKNKRSQPQRFPKLENNSNITDITAWVDKNKINKEKVKLPGTILNAISIMSLYILLPLF